MSIAKVRWIIASACLLGLLGCGAPNESLIVGVVSTTSNLDSSTLITGLDRDPAYHTIEGAVVFLSTDEDGKTSLEGYKTQSGREGNYAIRVTPLLGSSARARTYYLVVEKPGYQRLVQWITIGPYSPERKNTVLLKPDPASP